MEVLNPANCAALYQITLGQARPVFVYLSSVIRLFSASCPTIQASVQYALQKNPVIIQQFSCSSIFPIHNIQTLWSSYTTHFSVKRKKKTNLGFLSPKRKLPYIMKTLCRLELCISTWLHFTKGSFLIGQGSGVDDKQHIQSCKSLTS